MTTPANRRLAQFPALAVLPVLVLAVIAGILGMHVLTANHTAHTLGFAAPPSSATAAATVHGIGAEVHESHTHQDPDGNVQSVQNSVVQGWKDPSVVSCTSSFPCREPAGAACTPLAKAGSLTAPPPASSGWRPDALRSSRTAAVNWYTYQPCSPSPEDLSISRT